MSTENKPAVVEVTEELTPAQKMTIAIAKAKENRKRTKDEAKLKLLDNADYIGYLASMDDEKEDIENLQGLMDSANRMKAIVAQDGTKYNVHCYPVAEYIFGPIAGRILGLITGSSAMFTEERQTEFEALTNIPYLAFTRAREAIGSPAYFNKGVFADAVTGNGDDVKTTVMAILQLLDLDLEYANKLSTKSLEAWFKASKVKAEAKRDEAVKTAKVDSTEDFLLED